jgi:hypothetical protein
MAAHLKRLDSSFATEEAMDANTPKIDPVLRR